MILLLFNKSEIGLLQSCWSPFLNIGIILACLWIFGNSPVEKVKLIRFANGFERSFFNYFWMIVGIILPGPFKCFWIIVGIILPGPTTLWALKVLISASTSSGDIIGERKKDFSDCL